MKSIREAYIKFTAEIGIPLEKIFGRFWWYSLIHEKNTAISDVYHSICTDNRIENYNLFDAFCDALFKYLSFIARYLIFFKFIRKIKEKELIVTYADSLSIISTLKTEENKYMYVPQKHDWKEVKKEKDCYVIDNFLSIFDFLYVLLLYLKITFLFYDNIAFIKSIFWWKSYNNLPYELCKKDLYRSFAGDVLIEGIFYDRIFNRISKKIKNKKVDKKIIYVFEGRAWEKALCYHFSKSGYFVEKVGMVCSAVSDNNLQFFYHYIDVSRMPLPELIGVPGEILKEKFSKVYDEASIFIYDSNKSFLWGASPLVGIQKLNKLLLVLGANDKQNLELLQFVKDTYFKNIAVKIHPCSKLMVKEIGLEIEDKLILYGKAAIIAVSSTVTLDALSYGLPTIVPQLKHYVDFIPIDNDYKGQQFCYRVNDAKEFFEALSIIENIKLDRYICEEYIEKYFFHGRK